MVENVKTLKEVVKINGKELNNQIAFSSYSEGEWKDTSYKVYEEQTNALGQKLIDMNLKDEFIAICGENRYEWTLTYMSVVNGVGVIVPIDKELKKEEIVTLLDDSNSKVFVYTNGRFKDIEYIKEHSKSVMHYICMDKPKNQDTYLYDLVDENANTLEYENIEVDPDKMRMLLYTSGTTGTPKGVMLCHKNVLTVMEGIEHIVLFKKGDSTLSILPLHHTYECTLTFLYGFSQGAKIVFNRGLKYIVEDLQIAKPTFLCTVPVLLENIYRKILKKGGDTKVKTTIKVTRALYRMKIEVRKKVFSSIHEMFGGRLRLILSGASALDYSVVKAYSSFGFDIYQGYGLTETAPLTIANVDYAFKPKALGKPIYNTQAKIVEKDAFGIGEICVKGDNVMIGYYNNAKATDEVLEDGWLHTGDYGLLNKKGNIYMTGRKKNIIVTKNGKNIYPEEIEKILARSKYILECIVMSKEKDIAADTEIVAVIVPDKENFPIGESIEKIKAIIKSEVKEINRHLNISKKIRDIAIMEEEFIKTTTKKIKRNALGKVEYVGLN